MENEAATDSQKKFLKQLGASDEEIFNMTKVGASAKIEELKGGKPKKDFQTLKTPKRDSSVQASIIAQTLTKCYAEILSTRVEPRNSKPEEIRDNILETYEYYLKKLL